MKIFISHATEDKDEIARPLAEALREQGYEVWYDEYSLRLGDSLSKEIDRGLSTCDYGVVILSKSFFKRSWPNRELAGLVSRETTGSRDTSLILPIWHGVSSDDIRAFSPTLADRVAVSTSEGFDKVLTEINRVTQFIQPDSLDEASISPSRKPSAKDILYNIIPAGPIQPDDGYSPSSITEIENLVKRWDEHGKVSFLVKTDEKMSDERRKVLFHEEKKVYLLPSPAMHQLRIEVVDLSFKTIGMLWTPPNISDNEYHRAVEFFLGQMGFLNELMLKVPVSPIINSDDSFWVRVT